MYILKVYGPNLSGPFDTKFDTHILDDPAQAEIDGEWLTVRLPAYEGREEQVITVQNDEVVRRIPGRKPRGPLTVTYPPGQWSKTVVFEKAGLDDED